MTSDLSKSVYEGADIIDSRDVIARIEELEEERADLVTELETAHETAEAIKDGRSTAYDEAVDLANDAKGKLQEWDEDEDYGGGLKKLKELADDASGSPDWHHGETLIADDYFKEYAQELADDIGAVNKDGGWPNSYIDWDRAADALKQDYMSAMYGGTVYWIRA